MPSPEGLPKTRSCRLRKQRAAPPPHSPAGDHQPPRQPIPRSARTVRGKEWADVSLGRDLPLKQQERQESRAVGTEQAAVGQWDVLTHPQSQLLSPSQPEEKTKHVAGVKGVSRNISHRRTSGEGIPNCRVAELDQEVEKGEKIGAGVLRYYWQLPLLKKSFVCVKIWVGHIWREQPSRGVSSVACSWFTACTTLWEGWWAPLQTGIPSGHLPLAKGNHTQII